MLSGTIAKQITSNLKEELLFTCWYRLATNETSDEDDNFLPVSVRYGYVEKDSPLIATPLTFQVLTVAQQHSKCMCAMKQEKRFH